MSLGEIFGVAEWDLFCLIKVTASKVHLKTPLPSYVGIDGPECWVMRIRTTFFRIRLGGPDPYKKE